MDPNANKSERKNDKKCLLIKTSSCTFTRFLISNTEYNNSSLQMDEGKIMFN